MNINSEAYEQTNNALRKITSSTTFMSSSMYLRSLIQPQNEINVPPTKGLQQVSADREKDTFFRNIHFFTLNRTDQILQQNFH